MLRHALEVVAITGAVALLSGISSALGFGTTRAIPAIAGAGVATGLIFLWRGRGPAFAGSAAILASIGAFAVDWFVLFVLAAGYPELRELRRGPYYQALLVLIFGAIAALDVRSVSNGHDVPT